MNDEMTVDQEIARRRRWVREARRRVFVARVLLVILRIPELCGVRRAHIAADDQRDVISQGRYAVEEFLQCADKMLRRGRFETWDAYRLPVESDGYDGWLSTNDQYQGWAELDGGHDVDTQPQSGDRCPRCPTGHLIVANSRIRGQYRIRFPACKRCGHRPPNNKIILPLVYAPPRAKHGT